MNRKSEKMPRKGKDDASARSLASLYQMSFAKKLIEMNNNVDIVRYMESRDVHFMMQYKAAIKHLNGQQKDADESEMYRKQGNNEYVQQNFVQALELFNKSICFASQESKELSKGYANRSAVYFSIKMYNRCLENIKLARAAGYPEELAVKLDERQAKCETELKKSAAKDEPTGLKPKLSFPSHEKVPYIVNCLKMEKNRRFGRHIVATANLKAGDVIAVERPFNKGVVAREIRYTCCANCSIDNDFSLIPCSDCHSAMFCSQECLTEAKARFHDIECPLMNVLFDAVLLFSEDKLVNPKEIVALRLLIDLIRSFKCNVDDLKRFIRVLDNREENVFTIDYKKNQRLDVFATVLHLERNQTVSCPKVKNSTGLITGIFYKILVSSNAFKEMFTAKEDEDFLIDLLFRLIQIVNFNAFPITNVMKKCLVAKDKTAKFDRVCYGVYPFSSLMNHSCCPNTVHVKHGLDNVIIVVKPIKAGEQLFHCYGVHHFDFDRETRQEAIYDIFAFHCECPACKKDYQSFNFYDLVEDKDCIHPVLHLSVICSYNVNAIKALIPKYCDLLNKNPSKHCPEKQVKVAEKFLTKFWKIVYSDKMSLGRKQKSGFFDSV